jgi:hypothetical protein
LLILGRHLCSCACPEVGARAFRSVSKRIYTERKSNTYTLSRFTVIVLIAQELNRAVYSSYKSAFERDAEGDVERGYYAYQCCLTV